MKIVFNTALFSVGHRPGVKAALRSEGLVAADRAPGLELARLARLAPIPEIGRDPYRVGEVAMALASCISVVQAVDLRRDSMLQSAAMVRSLTSAIGDPRSPRSAALLVGSAALSVRSRRLLCSALLPLLPTLAHAQMTPRATPVPRAVPGTGQAQPATAKVSPSAKSPALPLVPSPAPVSPPSAPPSVEQPSVPLYRLTGYELRQEQLTDDDWRRMLGAARYRQDQAGKWLKILGGATAFVGAISLLVGLGNLANQTSWGRQPAESHQPDFEAFVIGFGCMAGVGGAALLTGVALQWSLPDRVRPIYLPQLQRDSGPASIPASPARSLPLSSFPTWAFAPAATRAWIQ